MNKVVLEFICYCKDLIQFKIFFKMKNKVGRVKYLVVRFVCEVVIIQYWGVGDGAVQAIGLYIVEVEKLEIII